MTFPMKTVALPLRSAGKLIAGLRCRHGGKTVDRMASPSRFGL